MHISIAAPFRRVLDILSIGRERTSPAIWRGRKHNSGLGID
jgi:hypothetical protein